MFKEEIRAPILAYFFISLGGLLLHIRIHPPNEELLDAVPVVCGVLTTVLLPFLFNYRRTVAWAYLINLAVVIAGTLGMAYYSMTEWGELVPVTVVNVILRSTLADILILWAKLPLAQMILHHFRQ